MWAAPGGIRTRLLIAGFCAVACSITLLAADNSTPPKIYPGSSGVLVLKKTVRRVVVDVVVRGSDGKPVQGLREKDFSVSEDGHQQRVLSFDVHAFDSGSIAIPANAPALPPNVYVNVPKQPEKGPLFILLLDMANTEELTDQIIARQQALKFIGSKPEGTRFAIFLHYDGLRLIQGFTDDKSVLYSVLDPKNPKSGLPKAFLMASNFHRGSDPTVAMISALTHVADFLTGIPGRKNLIWMSAQFPISVYSSEGDPHDRQLDVRKEFDELMRAQIAVYPLNVRGVITNPEGRLTGGGPHTGVGGESVGSSAGAAGAAAAGAPAGAVTNAATPTGAGLANELAVSSTFSSTYRDDMMSNDIASATGGRAIYSDNDLAGALQEMVVDGSNYYTLTYSPSNPNYDGRLRNIKVEIGGHKYHLQYRRSYYADDPDSPLLAAQPTKKGGDSGGPQSEEDTQARPIFSNLQHGAPLVHQLIFKARVHPVGAPALATEQQMTELASQPAFATEHKRKSSHPLKPVQVQTYAIYYVLVGSQIRVDKDGALPLEFAAVAYDGNGWALNSVFQKVQNNNDPAFAALQARPPESWEPSHQKVYRAMQELVIPMNATSIRIAIRDTDTERIGALEIPLPLAPETATAPEMPPQLQASKAN